MADKAGLWIQISRVRQTENLSTAGNCKQEINMSFFSLIDDEKKNPARISLMQDKTTVLKKDQSTTIATLIPFI